MWQKRKLKRRIRVFLKFELNRSDWFALGYERLTFFAIMSCSSN